MMPIIWVVCAFCFGCLVSSYLLARYAKRQLQQAVHVVERGLEVFDKGHLLRVIDGGLPKEDKNRRA